MSEPLTAAELREIMGEAGGWSARAWTIAVSVASGLVVCGSVAFPLYAKINVQESIIASLEADSRQQKQRLMTVEITQAAFRQQSQRIVLLESRMQRLEDGLRQDVSKLRDDVQAIRVSVGELSGKIKDK